MKQDDTPKSTDVNSVRTIAELQTKLQMTEAELERTKTQRDYALRLLRQQQNISTVRIQNDAYAFFLERDTALTRLLTRLPRGLKDLFPVRCKQFVRNFLVRIR